MYQDVHLQLSFLLHTTRYEEAKRKPSVRPKDDRNRIREVKMARGHDVCAAACV